MKHLQCAGVRPTLRDLAKAKRGNEDADRPGAHHFENGRDALEVVRELGSSASIPEPYLDQPATVYTTKRGFAAWESERLDGEEFPGALAKGKRWTLALGVPVDRRPDDERLAEVDGKYRYVIVRGPNGLQKVSVFMCDADDDWIPEPDNHLNYCRFRALGIEKDDIPSLVGLAILHPWHLVHLPFQPEYPGERRWNLGAPQFKFQPSAEPGPTPHWDMVLEHCCGELDEALRADEWAKRSGIDAGRKYGLAWIANLIRFPFEPLPYLFFYGEQNSGKSIFHEALALLMTKGVTAADRALTNANDFNGELANAVLAYVEEKNVATSPGAYAKLKDWVTSPTLTIRRMRTDAYRQPNTLHFVQCANESDACPSDFGDTRITMMHVAPLEKEIPKPLLIERLKEEAPAFMRTLLDLPLPTPEGRLRLPAIRTAAKEAAALSSVPELAQAIVGAMAERESWSGVAKSLPELLGVGDWPTDARIVKRQLQSAAAYLRHHGIATAWTRTNAGQELSVAKLAA